MMFRNQFYVIPASESNGARLNPSFPRRRETLKVWQPSFQDSRLRGNDIIFRRKIENQVLKP